MHRLASVLLTAALIWVAAPAWAGPFSFATGQPDGRLGAATRIGGGGLIEIEAGDDFTTSAAQTSLTSMSFFGLLPGVTPVGSVSQVVVEIYRLFPLDSTNPPSGRVPTRVNSPSDVAFDERDSNAGQLTFGVTSLGAFAVANSVVNGINPIPNQTTGGEGPVSGIQVRIDVSLAAPFLLPPGHYFFVPQVRLSGGGTFYWLSSPGPPLFTGDLQTWIRNENLAPDWLRVGTDIVGGAPAPTFNMAFTLTGITSDATLAAAVLPSSRSVLVGSPATAFATVINTGVTPATSVGIAVNGTVPAAFSYQTTNPATNQVSGTPNTPIDIPGGGRQTYVIALTPTAPFLPVDVAFSFSGTHTNAALVLPGINTLLLSASATPVPDVVALAATTGNDGIVNLPGAHGNGAFAVATVNVGSAAPITVTADTGPTVLPVLLFVCETNPGTGACLAPPAASVTTQIDAHETPTFGVFVAGSGAVVFDPANNRVFVRFNDLGGLTRGSTSVAVRTQ
jgi:hypothetical protein